MDIQVSAMISPKCSLLERKTPWLSACVTRERTAGKPAKINLSADRTTLKANGEDLSFVTVSIVDKNGRTNPKAGNLVHFKVEVPGSIVAAGSSNPMSTESYQRPQRKAYKGRCMVIIKSQQRTGDIMLSASSDNLPTADIQIHTKK